MLFFLNNVIRIIGRAHYINHYFLFDFDLNLIYLFKNCQPFITGILMSRNIISEVYRYRLLEYKKSIASLPSEK
jgi:hypothetical protein